MNYSTFPSAIDTFVKKYSLTASDVAKADEFRTLKKKANRSPDEDVRLNQLQLELSYAFIDPEEWNKFQDALVNMETFIKSGVEGYIVNKQTEFDTTITLKTTEMNSYVDGKKTEISTFVNGKKAEIDTLQTNTITTVNTTKDSALNAIEQKKASVITYLDSTQAGELRRDLGVMGDSAVTGLSLIDKTNGLKAAADLLNSTVSAHTTSLSVIQSSVTTLNDSLSSLTTLFKSGSSNFNSTTGVIIPHSKGDLAYRVIPIPTQNPNGYLGEIWVEKAATSFKVCCSGSATTSFDYFMYAT